MDQWLELRAQKQILIDDLRAAIQYKPNREADLLAFMRLYIKEDRTVRPAILEQMRSCMDGRPYPNPYSYCYTEEDVARCDRLLTEFLDALSSGGSGTAEVDRLTERLTAALDDLNEARGYGLLDDWRSRKLCALIGRAEALALGGPKLEMR